MSVTTTRTIATSLANTLATTNWVPAGIDTPIVALDGIAGQIDIGAHPLVVVTPRQSAGLWKAQPEHIIEIMVCVDASANLAGNPSQSTQGPDGVLRYGVGTLLDDLAGTMLDIIRRSNPGAVLADLAIEYSYDTTPMQYATITATYGQTIAYQCISQVTQAD